MADTTVTARFRADTTDLQTKLGALQAQMMATSKKFSGASQAMISTGATLTKGVTLPIAAVGTAAIVAGANFEKSMNKVRAVSGATGSDFENMSDTAKELGRTTQFSASQAADGMSFLAMAGFEANDIVSAMPGVLNLAAAGQMDLAQAADIASNVLTGFGMEASELDGAIDVMAKTFTSANTSLDQLGEAMSYVAPIAASAGANFEEVNAAVGLLGNAGIQGSRAGTSLARVMSILTMNSSKTAAQLGSLGVSALDASGNLLPLESIIGQLERSGATTADVMSIFGQRAGPAMAALLSQGSGALRDLTDDLNASGGTAEEIAETQMEGLAGTMLRLKSAFEGAMIAIAESGVLDALTAVVETAADALSKFTAIWEKIPGPIKTVTVVLAAAAAAMGPILWAGGKVITLLGTMGAAWATLNRRVKTATRAIGTRVKTMELEIKTAMIKSRTQLGAFGAAAGVVGKKVVLAFRTIGTAAKSMIASLGPIGLAIAGVTVAFEVFMGKSAEAEALVDGLKDTVDKTTGSFTDLSAAMVAEQFRTDLSSEDIQTLENLGITVSDMTQAVLEGGDSFDEMNGKIQGVIDENSVLGVSFNNVGSMAITTQRNFEGMNKAVESSRDAMEAEQQAANDAAVATQRSGAVAGTAAEGFDDLADSAEDAKTQTQILNDMFSTFDANVAAIRSRDEFNGYMDDLDERLPKVTKNLQGNTDRARDTRAAILDAFDKGTRAVRDWQAATDATAPEVEARMREMTREIVKDFTDKGIDADQMREFMGANGIDAASIRVENELEGALGYIGSNVGAEAKLQGTYIGREMTNGLIAGINAGVPPMERAMSSSARSARMAYERQMGIASPSKVFKDIGYDLMDGLTIGIEQSNTDERVAEFGKDLTDRMARAIESGEETIYQAAKGSFVDWYQEVKSELQTNLDDAQSLFDDFAEGIQSSLMGGIDLGSAFSGQFDDAGASTGVSLLQGFRNQVRQADWAGNVFQAVRNQALAGGASQQAADALTQALAAEGPAIGGAIGQQILDEGMAVTLANEYGSVLDATRAVGEALMPEHLLIGRNNAQAEYDAWVERMGPGGDLRGQFLRDWRAVGVETSQKDYEGMRDALKKGGPVGDAIMNLFQRLGSRSAKRTADNFSSDIAGAQGARMNRTMDALAASLDREAKVTVYVEHVSSGLTPRAKGGPVSARDAYLVGERGPEIFMPKMAGNIIPNNRIGMSGNIPISGSGGGGGESVTNVNVNVNAGMGADGAEVGRKVVEAIRKYERRSGPVFASA